MDANLYALLRDTTDITNDNEYSFASFYGPKQRYKVRTSEAWNFWRGYCELVYNDESLAKKFTLGERLGTHAPVIASFKLKFNPNEIDMDDPYNEDFIINVIYCFQRVIEESVIINDSKMLACVTWETATVSAENNMIYVHFKLQFPYCKVEPSIQKRVFRTKLISKLRSMNVIAKLSHQPINDWNDIVENNVYDEPWLLYNSTTNPNEPKLSTIDVYNNLTIDDLETGELEKGKLNILFSPYYHSYVHQRIIDFAALGFVSDIDYYLPMLLSVNYWHEVATLKEGIDRPVDVISSSSSSSSSYGGQRQRVQHTPKPFDIQILLSNTGTRKKTPEEVVMELIPLLSRERVERDYYWRDVGAAIFSAFKGRTEGLSQWIRFTEQSDEHTEEECRTLYYTFRNSPITYKTIAWFAREDSPSAYDEWHCNWCAPYMARALSMTHTAVASALYHCFFLEFVYDGINWQEYEGHSWKRLNKGNALRQVMSDNFAKKFAAIRTELARQVGESSNPNFSASCEPHIKKITKLIEHLELVPFKSNILTESQEHFYIENFDNHANINPDLMGIDNGVIECCDKCAIFRPGKPEDFITIHSLVRYEENYNWSTPEVKAFLKWMHQAFTEEERFNYVMRLFASLIRSKNINKILPILTGDTDSSKSMTKRMLETVFGPYTHTFPTEVLTQNRKSSGPSPEIALAQFAKITFVQEPDDTAGLKSGMVKMLTGLDKFFARLCNKDGGAMEAMFTLFLICNKIPIIPGADNAVKTRVRIISFLSKWCDDAPESEEEQFKTRKFPIDRNFESKIDSLANAALWVFVQFYAEYKVRGLKQPQCVIDATEKYWQDNDVYVLFIKESYEAAVLPNGERDGRISVSISDVFNDFKAWFKEYCPSEKTPARDNAKYQLEQKSRLGPSYNGHWIGLKKKEMDLARV